MGSLSRWLEARYRPDLVAWQYAATLKGWRISSDFEPYHAITATLAAVVDYAPQTNLVGGLWVKKQIDGSLAAIGAARQYILRRPLTEAIPDMMPGATCEAEAARAIAGNVMFVGGVWVNPKMRRRGLAVEVAGALFAASMLEHDPDYVVAVTEKRLEGLSRAQGFAVIEPSVHWGPWSMNLCVSDRRAVLQNVAARMAQEPLGRGDPEAER